ncbi:MAG: RES family NAD+ phosphorylase [Spirosomataceae bacterium]|jgi:RES domain-containing protein
MKVFRLSKAEFSRDLSGKGAEIAGGRWNPRGVLVVYTSDSRALCMAEVAVHIPVGLIPKDYKIVEIEIPEDKILEVSKENLPENWNAFPEIMETKKIGEEWVKRSEFLILKVPSAVVEGDFNYLINPQNTDINQVKISSVKDFRFDSRLFQK